MLHHCSSTSYAWRLGSLLLCSAVLVGCATVKTETAEESESSAGDITPYTIARIPAGTVIGEQAPQGWSNLIFKSRTRIGAGDVDKLGSQAKDFSGLFFTSMVANAKPQGAGKGYRLDKVAYGLGTRIDGKDVIVTPESQKRLGANLGFLARTVLERSSDRIKQTAVAARSDTVAVVDNPAVLLYQGSHRNALLRFALLVDSTGRLDTFLWGINRNEEGTNQELIGAIEWLAPNQIQEPVLHVDGSQVSRLGIPSDTALALSRIHPGKKHLEPTEEFKKLATKDRVSPEDARQLERQLRTLAKEAGES
jgi:hypothetical protein